MSRTMPLIRLSLAVMFLSAVGSISFAQESPPKATAQEMENVTEAYFDEYVKSESRGVQDTWITLHNSSSKTLYYVWIEYYTCDGEHGVVKYSDFNTIPPSTSSNTVDTTRKICKCRLFWITKHGSIPLPHKSHWEKCAVGKYMYYVDVYFDDQKVDIVPFCIPCP